LTRAYEWLGKPIGEHEKDRDNRSYQRVVSGYAQRGTLNSGFATKDIKLTKSRLLRRRANVRIAVLLIILGAAFAAASAFTDNRGVDAVGRSIGVVLGGVAIVAFAVSRGDS
jgi:hypothetical protein